MVKWFGLVLLLSLSSCQMSEKKLKKIKATTVIENPFDITTLPDGDTDKIQDETEKKEASEKFHESGPTVVNSSPAKNSLESHGSKTITDATEKSKSQNKPNLTQNVKKDLGILKKIEEEKNTLEKNFPFKVGERIEYAVNYFALEAGRFVFEVKPIKQLQNRPVFHFYVSAKTSSIFAWVYTLKDFAESFWDMKTQRPYLMKIYGEESRYIREVQTAFDWTKKQARYQAKIVEVGKGLDEEDKTWDLKHMDAQDVVSALYFLRTKKLEVGKTFDFRVAEMGKDILVRAAVVEETVLSTKIGKFNTFVVKPTFSVNGAWKQKGEMKLWLTNDEYKTPIQFEAKIKVGTIRGRLHSLTR